MGSVFCIALFKSNNDAVIYDIIFYQHPHKIIVSSIKLYVERMQGASKISKVVDGSFVNNNKATLFALVSMKYIFCKHMQLLLRC